MDMVSASSGAEGGGLSQVQISSDEGKKETHKK
jgi:hypothetical protein